MIGISDLEYLCAEVRQIARKAGAFLRDERQKFDRERVEEKSAHNYVSTIVGSVIAGLGGLYYVMDYANGVWSNNFRHCFPKLGLLPKRVREA